MIGWYICPQEPTSPTVRTGERRDTLLKFPTRERTALLPGRGPAPEPSRGSLSTEQACEEYSKQHLEFFGQLQEELLLS